MYLAKPQFNELLLLKLIYKLKQIQNATNNLP